MAIRNGRVGLQNYRPTCGSQRINWLEPRLEKRTKENQLLVVQPGSLARYKVSLTFSDVNTKRILVFFQNDLASWT